MPEAQAQAQAQAEPEPEAQDAPEQEVVHGIKGYDADLKCRGFAFEIGETYEHTGPVEICRSGFHAIGGYPLEVFDYYPPSTSRYTETVQSGHLRRHDKDSKIASAKIAIGVELHLHDLIQRAVKWVFDRAKVEGETATGYQGAASSTGDRGAAMSSGPCGRVMGTDGCALFLVYRNPDSDAIERAWAGIVGRDGIKPSTWYRLNAEGQPEEVEG